MDVFKGVEAQSRLQQDIILGGLGAKPFLLVFVFPLLLTSTREGIMLHFLEVIFIKF